MKKVNNNYKATQRRQTILIPPRGNPEPWKFSLFLFKMKNPPCYSISLNSGGIKTKERFDTALQFCHNSKADFSILQETNLVPNKYVEIKNQWEGEVYISPGTIFRDGTLLLAKATAPKVSILKSDPNRKYIIFRLLI